MRIAIAGTGRVAAALGQNLTRLGHDVVFGARRLGDDAGTGPRVPLAECARDAQIVVLAVPFAAVAEVVPALGLSPGQILVDATNPFGAALPPGAGSGFDVVASLAGDGPAVVKAFNVIGAEHMADPPLAGGQSPVLPVAGTDPAAVATVAALATEMGFDAVDVGTADAAATMEAAAAYWGLIAFRGGRGRQHVLVSVRR